MGCSASNTSDQQLIAKNKKLEAQMSIDAKVANEKYKLLLLGAGESGKSTIFKQMKLIYGEKFSDEEKRDNIPFIHLNILQAMKMLVDQTVKMGITDVKATSAFETIRAIDENEPVTFDIGTCVQELWADEGIQQAWTRRSEFQVLISCLTVYWKSN